MGSTAGSADRRSGLRDSVERWLVHESYRFADVQNAQNHFTFVLNRAGSFENRLEVFHPVQQGGDVLVIGCLIPLKNNQNARYLKLNGQQRENFAAKVADYCRSIRAINKNRTEDGRLIIGVYAVMDDEGTFNQNEFVQTLVRVAEMGDEVTRFVLKTF